MSDLPAIALIEFNSIATGTFAADAMAKEAPLELLRTGTVHRGHYLVLVGGGTAEVERAHAAGMRTGSPGIVDEVVLCDVAPTVLDALEGKRREDPYDSLTVLETSTSPAILRAIDPAVKGAKVDLKEMRLANGLGGKGLAVLTAERHDVEAAVEIAAAALANRTVQLCHSVVSRIDEGLARQLQRSSRFSPLPDESWGV